MFTKTVLLFLSAAATLVSAQSSASASATSSAAAAATSGAVTVVKVSDASGDLKFDPSELTAEVGAWIEFRFWPKNHSVAQSAFDSPCTPLSGSSTIFSGFQPVDSSATDFPTYTIQINDTNPIWFYCSQGKHCQNGMVGVINAPSGKTLSTYSAAAAKAATNESPSKIFGGVEGTSASSSAGNSSSSGSTPSGTGAASASGSAGASAASGLKVAGWLMAAGAAFAGALVV